MRGRPPSGPIADLDHASPDRAIVELWRHGVRAQGEIGRRIGLDQRSVSRRIARMVQTGTWPFRELPVRGRTQVPVAPGFVAVPISRPRSLAAASPVAPGVTAPA
jgi:hypothetical protein